MTTLESRVERGRVGESDQVGVLAGSEIIGSEVLEGQAVTRIVDDGGEGRSFVLKPTSECSRAQAQLSAETERSRRAVVESIHDHHLYGRCHRVRLVQVLDEGFRVAL